MAAIQQDVVPVQAIRGRVDVHPHPHRKARGELLRSPSSGRVAIGCDD
jgi:hypothetical protein